MEANEASKKIYVPMAGDELHYHMACPNNEFQESIEYIRTDAFIKKVESFLNKKDDKDYYTIGYIKRHLEEIIKEIGL